MAKQFIKQEDGKLVVPVAENQCAFHINSVDNVCSDQFTLSKMREFIDSLDIKYDGTTPGEIVEKAKEATGCDSEICIIKNNKLAAFIDQPSNIIKSRFKPEGPAQTTAWLNNDNIDHALAQWSRMYPDFLHIPFQMVDFDEQETRLAQTDLCDAYDKNKRRAGCVINTDKSTGSGIHWFCIFCNLTGDKWTLEYFDSAGDYPKKSVHTWLNSQRMKLAEKFPEKRIEVVDVTRNNQLQKSTTECGVFSLWYILSRLNNIPYTYFAQPLAITDDMMYKFRKFLFRSDSKTGGVAKKNKEKNKKKK